MTTLSRFRILALIPGFFGLLGLAIAVATVPFRRYWSPVPGVSAGLLTAVVGAVACRELWRAGSWSVVAAVASGALTLALFLFFNYFFPLVQATTEPPSIVERFWYPAIVVTIVVLTCLAAWGARATSSAAA